MSAPLKMRTGRTEPAPPRDQETTTFTEILRRLVRSTLNARGAALVDFEGETVDYAGAIDPFELRVAAAHWQLVLSQLSSSSVGAVVQLTVRTRTRSYVLRRLHSGYAVVVVLHRHAAFAVSGRVMQEAEARLCAEAGWPPRGVTCWFGVDVETESDDPSRPARIRAIDGLHAVEVLGCMTDLKPYEVGFRVRLPNGAELMLIRERMGLWFADEHLDALF
jgi:hypothetical protein